jgi:hypothetical protein
MKGISLFIVMAAWIALCGWVVEKTGNFIPDRSMRLLTKFLLFVLIATTPLLNAMAKAAELCAAGRWSEQKAQWCAVAMSAYPAHRKGLQ